MSRYLWLVVLPGGAFVAAALGLCWLVKRYRQQSVDAELAALKPPIQKFGKLSPAESEAMQMIAARKRDHAEAKRLEARRIESGAESPERLRLVRR